MYALVTRSRDGVVGVVTELRAEWPRSWLDSGHAKEISVLSKRYTEAQQASYYMGIWNFYTWVKWPERETETVIL